MAQKTLTTSYLAQLTNANHDGVTQQIDDRLQGFETDNTMLQQAAAAGDHGDRFLNEFVEFTSNNLLTGGQT